MHAVHAAFSPKRVVPRQRHSRARQRAGGVRALRPCCVLCVLKSGSCCAECTFANLGGTADAVELVGPGSSAFCDCTFRNNVVAMTGTAVITARGADASLLRCTFSGNSGAGHLLMLGAAESHSTAFDGAGSALYSDQPREVCVEVALQSCARMGGTPGCVTDVTSPVQTLPADEWPPSDPAAAEEDSWFQETRKVCHACRACGNSARRRCRPGLCPHGRVAHSARVHLKHSIAHHR